MFFVPDVERMGAESLCYGIFGLSYILFFASVASDAVDQVDALTSDIIARVHCGCGSAFKGVLEQGTKWALGKSTFILSGLEENVMDLDLWTHKSTLWVRSVRQLLLVMRHFLKNSFNGGLFGARAGGGHR